MYGLCSPPFEINITRWATKFVLTQTVQTGRIQLICPLLCTAKRQESKELKPTYIFNPPPPLPQCPNLPPATHVVVILILYLYYQHT